MKIAKLQFTLALLALLVAACTGDREFDNIAVDGDTASAAAAGTVIEGVVMVKFLPEAAAGIEAQQTRSGAATGLASLDALAVRMGATSVRRIFPDGGKFEQRRRKAGLHLWYEMEFDLSYPATKAATELEDIDDIEIAEPVREIVRVGNTAIVPFDETGSTVALSSTAPFDDPYLAKQWHYNNDGSGSHATAGADIRVFDAWLSAGAYSGPDVIVAIIDGGVQYNHPDLAANMWINETERDGTTGTDDDGNGYTDDIYGYNFYSGTGTIAPNDHGTHVAGVVAAVNNNGVGVCGIAGGDHAGGAKGARLMSCQIFSANSNSATDSRMASAFVYAADNGAVIAQCSWGYENNGTMSTAMKEAIDYFVGHAGLDENNTQTGPMEGGIAFFATGNNGSTVRQYPAAYENVVAVAAMAPDYKLSSFASRGSWVNITAPGGEEYLPVDYEAWIFSTIAGGTYGHNIGTSMACPHASGAAALYLMARPDGNTAINADALLSNMLNSAYSLDGYDTSHAGQMGTGCVDVARMLNLTGTTYPILIKKFEDDIYLLGLGTGSPVIDLTEHFSDSDGDKLAYDIGANPAGIAEAVVNEDKLTVTSVNYGSAVISVAAVDPSNRRSQSGSFTVYVYSVPALKKNFNGVYLGSIGKTSTVSLSEYFEDADGDALTYSTGTNSSGYARAMLSSGSDVLSITSLKYGRTEVTVTATDPSGNSASGSLTVMSRDDNSPVDLYPNPVTTGTLYLRMGHEYSGSAGVNVYNSTGATVINKTVTLDPFNPVALDVGKLSGGYYSLSVTINGHTAEGTFVKY